jgi:hypothetical protein
MKMTEAAARREILALNARFITPAWRSLIIPGIILGLLIGLRAGGLM